MSRYQQPLDWPVIADYNGYLEKEVLNDPENDMDEFLRANLYDVKKELEKI